MVGKCPTTIVWKCTIRYLPERRVVQPGEQEEARRLDGAARHDDQLGLPGVRDAVAVR